MDIFLLIVGITNDLAATLSHNINQKIIFTKYEVVFISSSYNIFLNLYWIIRTSTFFTDLINLRKFDYILFNIKWWLYIYLYQLMLKGDQQALDLYQFMLKGDQQTLDLYQFMLKVDQQTLMRSWLKRENSVSSCVFAFRVVNDHMAIS